MNKILDLLIPRFTNDRVAIVIMENGDYQSICLEHQLRDDDIYDKIITVRVFNLFGLGLFPKMID